MAQITPEVTDSIVQALKENGFDIDTEIVMEFAQWGSVPNSNIGTDFDDGLTDALQDEFDRRGIEV